MLADEVSRKQYFKDFLNLYPSFGSFLGYNEYDDKSENFLDRKLYKKFYNLTKRYIKLNDINKLTKKNDIKTLGFIWNLKDQLLNLKTNLWMMPLSSFENIITNSIYYNKEFYPLNDQKDIDNLLKRLLSVNKMIDDCVKTLKIGIKHKMVIPKLLCKIVIDELEKYISTKEYIIKIKPSLDKKNYDYIALEFSKKVSRLINFLKNVYLKKCNKKLGLCYLPNGRKLYKQLVISNTTLSISPKEVFEYGKTEIERITKEFKLIANKIGAPTPLNINDFYDKIMNDPSNYAKNEKELLENYKFQRDRIKKEVIDVNFNYSIKNHNKIKTVPKYLENSSASAYYYPGNYTQTRKGTFYVNSRNLKENPLYSTYVLSIHEGEPGHHYQFQYMIEKKIPVYDIFLFDNTAFVEGWGLYTESLGKYTDIEYFGKLCYEMLRSVRLVVDVGIHYYGWSWNKAFNYMKRHIPMHHDTIKSELLRYISIPGQAIAYKIGERVFLDLQKKYLKNGGNIKDYHDSVLENGVLPLDILLGEPMVPP